MAGEWRKRNKINVKVKIQVKRKTQTKPTHVTSDLNKLYLTIMHIYTHKYMDNYT